jgi:xanthine dehydrogenase accessory factor
MKDQKAIIEAYRKIDLTQRKAAMATVVKVRGSSYRSPGARMLITDDGRWIGSISGGCLEGDALRKARQVMQDKKPLTVTYDTREESNQNLGIGLGCNGVIDVLIEPADPADKKNPVQLFEGLINTKEPLALATIFSSQDLMGEKLLISANKESLFQFSNGDLNHLVTKDLAQIFETQRSEAREYILKGDKIDVFVELIQPCISLIIFGGGFDARPVPASQIARMGSKCH